MAGGQDTRAAKRYSTALFQAAQKAGSLDVVEKDIYHVVELMQQTPKLHEVWLSPLVPASRKRSLIGKTLGGELDKLTLSFLDLLVDKGREEVLEMVAFELRHLADAARHLVRAEAVFAVEPTADERVALTRSLEQRTSAHVQLSYHVDAGILGGVIIRLQDTVIDGSVRGTLERLRAQMLAE